MQRKVTSNSIHSWIRPLTLFIEAVMTYVTCTLLRVPTYAGHFKAHLQFNLLRFTTLPLAVVAVSATDCLFLDDYCLGPRKQKMQNAHVGARGKSAGTLYVFDSPPDSTRRSRQHLAPHVQM